MGKGGWGDPALAYPHIEIPKRLKPFQYRLQFPVTWAKFEELRDRLRDVVPPELPLPAGTDFGPLKGVVGGPYHDFNWIWNWECLVRRTALEQLQKELGNTIHTVPARVTSRRKEKPDFCELVALPLARLSEASRAQLRPDYCSSCGQQFASGDYSAYVETSQSVSIKASSLPVDTHIVRIRELSRGVLCTERFRQACAKFGLGNIDFEPITVVAE